MKRLADISTFNRLCRVVENSQAPLPKSPADQRQEQIEDYYDQLGLAYAYIPRLVLPHRAETRTGKALIAQQLAYLQYKNWGTFDDYFRQLDTYRKASREFRNLYANLRADKEDTRRLDPIRNKIREFDSSIKEFVYDLQHNKMLKDIIQ